MPNYFLIDNLVCLADSEKFTIPVHHQSARISQKDSGVSFLQFFILSPVKFPHQRQGTRRISLSKIPLNRFIHFNKNNGKFPPKFFSHGGEYEN